MRLPEERRVVVAHRGVRLLHIVESVAYKREGLKKRITLQEFAALSETAARLSSAAMSRRLCAAADRHRAPNRAARIYLLILIY